MIGVQRTQGIGGAKEVPDPALQEGFLEEGVLQQRSEEG
jgi:hypothetical protein